MKKVCFGIDIGGTNTEIGMISEKGVVIEQSKFKTNDFENIEDFIGKIVNTVTHTFNNHKNNFELAGIGIGAPNGNFYSGSIENAPNLKWKGYLPLVSLMKEKIDTEIILTNDANAAAIGEKIYGAAQNMNDFILITLGTGLGSGFYANGKLIYGYDGFAGELGHTIYKEDGRPCGCGRKGCLETYASATGIVTTAIKLLSEYDIKSSLRDNKSKLTSKNIATAALEGDEIAIKAFELTGKALGFKLADAVAITSPEAIIFFGGLALSGDLIINPTKKYMEYYLLPIFQNKVKLILSELSGNNAAILGAGALIWEKLLK